MLVLEPHQFHLDGLIGTLLDLRLAPVLDGFESVQADEGALQLLLLCVKSLIGSEVYVVLLEIAKKGATSRECKIILKSFSPFAHLFAVLVEILEGKEDFGDKFLRIILISSAFFEE